MYAILYNVNKKKFVPRCNKRHALRVRYNMSMEEFEMLKARQQGVCAICHRPETFKLHGKETELCVDHDHETGYIRGLLCRGCNMAIGYLKTGAAIANALEYMKTHGLGP